MLSRQEERKQSRASSRALPYNIAKRPQPGILKRPEKQSTSGIWSLLKWAFSYPDSGADAPVAAEQSPALPNNEAASMYPSDLPLSSKSSYASSDENSNSGNEGAASSGRSGDSSPSSMASSSLHPDNSPFSYSIPGDLPVLDDPAMEERKIAQVTAVGPSPSSSAPNGSSNAEQEFVQLQVVKFLESKNGDLITPEEFKQMRLILASMVNPEATEGDIAILNDIMPKTLNEDARKLIGEPYKGADEQVDKSEEQNSDDEGVPSHLPTFDPDDPEDLEKYRRPGDTLSTTHDLRIFKKMRCTNRVLERDVAQFMDPDVDPNEPATGIFAELGFDHLRRSPPVKVVPYVHKPKAKAKSKSSDTDESVKTSQSKSKKKKDKETSPYNSQDEKVSSQDESADVSIDSSGGSKEGEPKSNSEDVWDETMNPYEHISDYMSRRTQPHSVPVYRPPTRSQSVESDDSKRSPSPKPPREELGMIYNIVENGSIKLASAFEAEPTMAEPDRQAGTEGNRPYKQLRKRKAVQLFAFVDDEDGNAMVYDGPKLAQEESERPSKRRKSVEPEAVKTSSASLPSKAPSKTSPKTSRRKQNAKETFKVPPLTAALPPLPSAIPPLTATLPPLSAAIPKLRGLPAAPPKAKGAKEQKDEPEAPADPNLTSVYVIDSYDRVWVEKEKKSKAVEDPELLSEEKEQEKEKGTEEVPLEKRRWRPSLKRDKRVRRTAYDPHTRRLSRFFNMPIYPSPLRMVILDRKKKPKFYKKNAITLDETSAASLKLGLPTFEFPSKEVARKQPSSGPIRTSKGVSKARQEAISTRISAVPSCMMALRPWQYYSEKFEDRLFVRNVQFRDGDKIIVTRPKPEPKEITDAVVVTSLAPAFELPGPTKKKLKEPKIIAQPEGDPGITIEWPDDDHLKKPAQPEIRHTATILRMSPEPAPAPVAPAEPEITLEEAEAIIDKHQSKELLRQRKPVKRSGAPPRKPLQEAPSAESRKQEWATIGVPTIDRARGSGHWTCKKCFTASNISQCQSCHNPRQAVILM